MITEHDQEQAAANLEAVQVRLSQLEAAQADLPAQRRRALAGVNVKALAAVDKRATEIGQELIVARVLLTQAEIADYTARLPGLIAAETAALEQAQAAHQAQRDAQTAFRAAEAEAQRLGAVSGVHARARERAERGLQEAETTLEQLLKEN